MFKKIQGSTNQNIKTTSQQIENAQRILQIFKSIHSPLQNHESPNLKIFVGSAKVIELTGKSLYVNPKHFTDVAATEIQRSLSNPEQVKKTISAQLDGEILHKVSSTGQVFYSQIENFTKSKVQSQGIPILEHPLQHDSIQRLIDELSEKEFKISALTKAVKTLTQTVENLQAESASKESKLNIDVIQPYIEQSATLYALVSRQTDVLNRLTMLMEKTQRNPLDKLEQWFQNTRQSASSLVQSAKTNFQQLPNNFKLLVEQKVRIVQTKALETVDTVKQHVVISAQQFKQEVTYQANNIKREVKDQTLTLGIAILNRGLQELAKMGEHQPETGERVFKSKRGVTLVATEHSTQILARNGLPFVRDGVPTEFMRKALSEEKYDVSDFGQMVQDVKEVISDAMKVGVQQMEIQNQQNENQQQNKTQLKPKL